VGAHHRIAAAHDARDQIIDETVFRASQGGNIQPAGRQKITRVRRSAVGRIEQHRPLAGLGLENLEWRVEFVANFTHV
jgi:hypothetical protein